MVTVTILDIDSTLITIECIDELGHLGNKAEIASITAQAMRGEFDHPAGRRAGISYPLAQPGTFAPTRHRVMRDG